MTTHLTEADVQNCSWTLVEQTEDYRRYIGRGTHPVTGQEIVVQKTEALVEPHLLKLNEQLRNDTDGQRWGQGSGSERGGNVPLIHVGSIPLNKFFAEIAPHQTEGDKDHLKWWLSRPENAPFRTRRGNL